MLRIALFVFAMVLIAQLGEGLGIFAMYRDYILAGLLTLLLKPWILDQFEG